mmetsp:Transcript_59533/g.98110  ORF Transcript_59533/g.98110 Transcript_59533/m.98110 type:complete len:154 (+) Transcript_59533:1889-2350(+)
MPLQEGLLEHRCRVYGGLMKQAHMCPLDAFKMRFVGVTTACAAFGNGTRSGSRDSPTTSSERTEDLSKVKRSVVPLPPRPNFSRHGNPVPDGVGLHKAGNMHIGPLCAQYRTQCSQGPGGTLLPENAREMVPNDTYLVHRGRRVVFRAGRPIQ